MSDNEVRLIDANALLKAMEEERQYLLARGQTGAEHIIVHHCLPIIDNAPTINTENCEGCPYCPNNNSGIPIGVE